MYRLYNHGGMFDGCVGMPFGGLWMILLPVVPMLLLAVLLKYLIIQPRGSGYGQGEQEMHTPLDVLKTAYRGEISREEHLRTEVRAKAREQAARLLSHKRTDLLSNFISSKTGRPFKAYLVMEEDSGKVTFDFPPREGEGDKRL